MGMAKVLPEIPALRASYSTGRVLRLPVNITVSVSYRCNSRCKTCNVWLLPNDDLTLSEWDRVYESLGDAPYWFTFSGGEPTLRKELPEMVASAYRHCRPGIINIPTNGIQHKVIPGRIEQVLQAAPKSQVIINLSLDGVGLKHDEVRGVRNNWSHAMITWAALKELQKQYKHLTLGIHTVISNFNVDSFPELCEYVQRELEPDSYITEIAEERVELDTVGLGITPTVEKYTVAIDTLLESMREQRLTGVAEVTQAFRRQYYDLVKRTLREQRQVIPCMAGVASAQIAPNGDVWPCCVRAQSMGNLREHDYDFGSVWRTGKAAQLRRSIKAGECHCPLANAAYTNMLTHGPTVTKVVADVARSRVARRRAAHMVERSA
ncbi:MAG: radical protein [Solirubrobacterales bacterium]|jgi:MoaA/NifB/PqqE/SkfB family radical SAM enzyme|nr:radical protein [Solirubrobacterales bacterium]